MEFLIFIIIVFIIYLINSSSTPSASKAPTKINTETLPSAEKYTGEFRNGLRHGKGKAFWPNGGTYEGDFINGKAHGKGTYVFPD